MIDQLREGDVVTVTKYDRLSRSLQDLLAIVDAIRAKGVGFRSLAEDIDTTTSAGRLVFHVFVSIAQFEREQISKGTRKDWLRPERPAGSVAGPLPCPVSSGMRFVGFATRKDVASLRSPGSRSVRIRWEGLEARLTLRIRDR